MFKQLGTYVPGTSTSIVHDDENFLYFPDRVIFWYPYSSTSMEWGLRRVVPAAAVTTHAKPDAQQQLARDLEVERAAMAALSASKFRRGAARQSAATSMAGLLPKKQSQSLGFDPYVHTQRTRHQCQS